MTDKSARERLKRLAEKATAGPWHTNDFDDCGLNVRNALGDRLAERIGVPDAEYIAACSPDVVLSLLRQLEEAEQQVESYRVLARHNRPEPDDPPKERDPGRKIRDIGAPK